jgi:hypothetical protein
VGEQISSRSTFILKWVFPLAWSGMIVFFMIEQFSGDAAQEDLVAFVVPVIMLAGGLVLFKFMLWNLADVMYDHRVLVEDRHGRAAHGKSVRSEDDTPLAMEAR